MSKPHNYKNIKEICNEIDLIIANKNNKIDYKYLYSDLDNVLRKRIDPSDIVDFSFIVLKIAQTKNRIIRHLEKSFWDFVNKLPFQLILINGIEIDENESIEPNIDYDNPEKNILSKLFDLSKKILELPDDNSKGSGLRRSQALKLIVDLSEYYHVPNAKEIFFNSIESHNVEEQFNALEGLENYYEVTEEEIDDSLLKTLNEIFKNTKDRTIASTCLKIQINAGIIDEFTGICEMDDWKDENYY
jgi:hypothetical protein